jgi:hypothetical protein
MNYVWIKTMMPPIPSPSRIWYVGYASQRNCETDVSVWFDGASRNNGLPDNPMSAGFGVCAVHVSGRVIFGGYGYLGSVSNNRAEFTAFAAACQWVAESGVPSATVLDGRLGARGRGLSRAKNFALTGGVAPPDGRGQGVAGSGGHGMC